MSSISDLTPRVPKRMLALAALAFSVCSYSGATHAKVFPFDFFQATHFIGVSKGTSLSDLAKNLGNSGFETSEGNMVRFDKWYSTNWVDVRLDLMTQISPRWGVLWGFNTGERGKKYSIDPSFKLGLLAVYPMSKASKLSFSVTTIIGGRFQERSCTADYGDIGGVQEVNCRMAATELDPAQTLGYLINQDPSRRNEISLQYTLNF